jgi:hypothetical protein
VRRPTRTVSSLLALISAQSVVLPSPLSLFAVATVTVMGFVPCNSLREWPVLEVDISGSSIAGAPVSGCAQARSMTQCDGGRKEVCVRKYQRVSAASEIAALPLIQGGQSLRSTLGGARAGNLVKLGKMLRSRRP